MRHHARRLSPCGRAAGDDLGLEEELVKAQSLAPALEEIIIYENLNSAEIPPLLDAYSAEFANVATSQDDIALIAFSSGTTGEPKATVHFQRDLLAVCDTFSKYVLKPSAEDIFCGSPPLAFTFGLGGLLLFPMRVGASTLLLPKVTGESLLQAIERHRCTICFTAPTLYRSMLELVARFDQLRRRRIQSIPYNPIPAQMMR